MKKVLVLLSIVLLFSLCSCNNTSEPKTPVDQTTTQEKETEKDTGNEMTFEQSLFFVSYAGYIHNDYSSGDDLSGYDLASICMFTAVQHKDKFDFVKEDTSQMTVTVSEDDMQSIATALFGDDCKIKDYNHFLGTGIYSESNKSYTFSYGRSWGSEPFTVDCEKVEIKEETENDISVLFSMKGEKEGKSYTILYTFEKKPFHGTELYRIKEIKKSV